MSKPLLAISATYTAEPLAETLAFWMRELDLDYQVRFAPYNQVFQQLLDPASLLGSNHDGINVLLLRFEDWLRFKPAGSPADLEGDLRQLLSLIEAGRSPATPLVVAICPASPALAAAVRPLEALAAARLLGLPAVHLITPETLAELYPVADAHDPHADELGHVPYTPEYFAALGTMLARRIHALRTPPYKVIALDCDDTLWAGICGEDGPEGVYLDPPRRALQEFLLAQRAAGMLLCLASKNNPEDVEETFRAHPEMPLGLEHFVATRINWEPKPKNLAALAEELELGLESFIFIDDNIKESSEVEANCPEALALTLPANPAGIPHFLRHVWAFDHLRVTEEDRRRNDLYAQRVERSRAEKQASSLGEFLASLRLEVRIAPATEEQLPRVSQLTYRTNQMNFTTVRRAEGELRELLAAGAECLTVHVSDRFGSYGLTGVMIFTTAGQALSIDTFLLSCRALGRGVEHRMLARLGEIAAERGLELVEARYRRTQRNAPALLLLESVAAGEKAGDEVLFRMPAATAAAISYRPNGPKKPAPAGAGIPPAAGPRRETAVDYERIAEELSEPARLVAEMRAARRPRPMNGKPAVEPRTELEALLARIWAEALGVASVGVHDNFFDLGGHSLLAVGLLSKVRKELGIELSLEVVYSGDFTVAELAKAIELKELERAGSDEYAALVAELEKLSDEEVRELLAREGQEGE